MERCAHHILSQRLKAHMCLNNRGKIRFEARGVTKFGEILHRRLFAEPQMHCWIIEMGMQNLKEAQCDLPRNTAQRIAQPCVVKPDCVEDIALASSLCNRSAQDPHRKACRHRIGRDRFDAVQQIVDPVVNETFPSMIGKGFNTQRIGTQVAFCVWLAALIIPR